MEDAQPPNGAQPPLPSAGPSPEAPPPLPGAEPVAAAAAGAAPAAPAAPAAAGDNAAPPLPADGVGVSPTGAPPLPEEEEDPLVVAEREREAAEKAKEAESLQIPPYDEEALKEFYTDLKDAEREGEVNRILSAFKLNPFEQLNLHNDATNEEVRRQYRKVSLMVHPDKCKHARAKDAFEVIGAAQKELLDEEKRVKLVFLLQHAKEEVKKDWKKAAKGDAAVRLAALMDEDGKQGVAAAFEQTDEFHEQWRIKARDVLARAEWRRRKLTKRIGEETERAKEEFKEEKAAAKQKVQHEKAWEKTREERVGSWRDFVGPKGGAKKQKTLGGLKPPKSKESDSERRYIQRPTGEQFRPPPMKHAGPKREEKD
ncbi:hypothetical protein D9Q98_007564 [Chlorella vulgaris]|uniref:J domain-containing protein n=1 Tax=Chlorella vulgaris TaxID=3077 RepID=A0A9D4YVP9_CHLVU|nr:hypothetical protein D9Q98_007564 [Chlorella vulgaris]